MIEIVYVLSNGENIKIGMSDSVTTRALSIQSQSGIRIQIIKVYKTGSRKNDKDLESRLHSYFKEERIYIDGHSTEWFNASVLPLIDDAVVKCSKEIGSISLQRKFQTCFVAQVIESEKINKHREINEQLKEENKNLKHELLILKAEAERTERLLKLKCQYIDDLNYMINKQEDLMREQNKITEQDELDIYYRIRTKKLISSKYKRLKGECK